MENKTIESLVSESEKKWHMWLEISEDKQSLENRKKTKEEALILANYFEGRFAGLCDARKFIET